MSVLPVQERTNLAWGTQRNLETLDSKWELGDMPQDVTEPQVRSARAEQNCCGFLEYLAMATDVCILNATTLRPTRILRGRSAHLYFSPTGPDLSP